MSKKRKNKKAATSSPDDKASTQPGTNPNAESATTESSSKAAKPTMTELAKGTSDVPTQAASPRVETIEQITTKSRMTRTFSFIVLLAIVGLISALSYQVLHTFIMPMFVAALLVVIFGPTHELIRDFCGNRKRLAAGLTTAAILLIVLAPIAWAVAIGVRQGIDLAGRDWGDSVQKLEAFPKKLGLDMPNKLSADLLDLELQIESLQLDEGEDPAASAESKKKLIARVDEKLKSFQIHLDESIAAETTDDGGWLTKRIESSKPALATLREKLVGETDSVRAMLASMDLDASIGASQALVDQYQSGVESAMDAYREMRLAIHGGTFWAPIVELLNPSQEQFRSWQSTVMENLRAWMVKLTGQTTSIMGGLLMQLFILTLSIFYFLLDGPEMVRSAMELSPIDDAYEEEMITEFSKLSRAVVVATLLSAIAQGLLAGIGYACVWGGESLFMLIILTTLLAMVPFVGAAAVWVPVCIYLAFVEEGRIAAAIGLGLYGFFIISMADNIIKPWVLKGQSNLHPLFALLSVLGGVQALGPIGVLVGPMIVAFLQSLLNILHRDLKRMDETRLETG